VSKVNDTASAQQIPANFVLEYSPNQIASRVEELSEEIGRWCSRVWSESHTDVLVIPVLRGGIFFFSDLVRRFPCSVEIAPVRTEAYDGDQNGVQRAHISIYSEGLAVKGRVVLIVDDVCDSGRTLEALEKELLEKGAREVRSVVLIRRLLNVPTFVPCWVGFEYSGLEWFVGYGMDDSQRWRNLPGIHVIKRGG